MQHYLATFRRIFPKKHYVLASITLVLGVFTTIYALGVSQGFFLRNAITRLDARLLDIALSQRGDTRSAFFLFFTYLGNWEIITSLAVLVVIILLLFRHRRALWFFIASLAIGQASSLLFKLLLARSRPDNAHALITQGGYSFPSGHALGSFLFYGVLAYFVFTLVRTPSQRALTVLSSLTVISLIGASRLYLGVHWLSDVVAGWIMGATLLIVFIVFFEHRKALFPTVAAIPPPSRSFRYPFIIGLVLAECVFIAWFFLTHPLPTN